MNSQRPPSPLDVDDELEASPRDIDSVSIDSTLSVPDLSGRRLVTLDDEQTTTVYEAWELVLLEHRHIRKSWKSFFGIKFGSEWVNLNDGYVLINSAVTFDQGELTDMHEDAIRGYQNKRGTNQETAYEQDLANRAYDLPSEIYDKVQQLLEDRTIATNQNPYRKREWHLVLLKPGEFQMTTLLPERKRKGLFPRKRKPITRTWFVILRGQETKSTKQDGGWRAFPRNSNPWWSLDKRETKEERERHKDIMKRTNRARSPHHPRPRPRSGGPPPPHPGLPMDR